MPAPPPDARPDPRPRVAITTDLIERNGRPTAIATTAYAEAVERAGGFPVMLAPIPSLAEAAAHAFDAYVLVGGDDPRTEPFGVPTDPRVKPVAADRQAFETALLEELRTARPDAPVLGVCLGMQLMALVSGGSLQQWMPDVCPTAADHWDREHAVEPAGGAAPSGLVFAGTVASTHRQAVDDPGRFEVVARAHDGTVEAIRDPARRFALGVQWHAERTAEPALGSAVFDALLAAAR